VRRASLQKLELNDGIANFYDESSELWESMWGEHMHHGYYPADGAQVSNQQAQLDMIERTLSWAGVESVHQVRSMPRSCASGISCGGSDFRHQALNSVLCVSP
jgi:tocopherol O-methyltransferase